MQLTTDAAKMTGGQALVRQLIAEGVTDVFGLPGVQLDWAVEAFRQHREQLRLIVPRHEQATSYMADGYARTTGKTGVCMVVPGPGLLNAMAGLSTGYACNSRMLCISGNIHSSAVGKGIGLLHEVRNQSEILAAVTKWRGSAASPAEVPSLIRQAIATMQAGTPQPVGVEISHDILSASADVSLQPVTQREERMVPDVKDIEAAAALLERAQHPVIFVGGGVLAARASEALAAVATKLGAPVVMGENGKGALSDRHPLALNALAGRAAFKLADVALIVGSRFVDIWSGKSAWAGAAPKLVFLNTDAAVAARHPATAASITADAQLGLVALEAALSARARDRADLALLRADAQKQLDAIEPQRSWAEALRTAIPDDGILVNELTQVGYFARVGYPVYGPGTFLSPGYQGTLGYGFATALGAAVGNPGRAVVSITGDGGFGWTMQELATARKYNLRIAVVVFNDQQFGNVRRMQVDQFAAPYGTELVNPDFGLLARAFGVDYMRADEPKALQHSLREALQGNGPYLIEARVGEMPSPWHLLRLSTPAFAAPQGTQK